MRGLILSKDGQLLHVGTPEELKAGKSPQWSGQLPDRDIWKHLVAADSGDEAYARWNKELVESSGYEGLYAVYWDKDWRVTGPEADSPYLGIIYQGAVEDMERTDIQSGMR